MMKRKHWAALEFILAIIPLGVMGFNVFTVLQSPGYTQASAYPTVLSVEMPGPDVVREIAQLTGEINTLNAGVVSDKTQIDLSLLGYEPPEDTDKSHGALGATGEDSGDSQIRYAVSLAFSGETKGFCVIDGKFYPQGATLPDGAKIVKVGLNGY